MPASSGPCCSPGFTKPTNSQVFEPQPLPPFLQPTQGEGWPETGAPGSQSLPAELLVSPGQRTEWARPTVQPAVAHAGALRHTGLNS